MHNHRVETNARAALLDFDHTLPAYLREAGYRTGLVGKFLNAWDLTRAPPHFDYFVMSRDFPYYGGVWNFNGEVRISAEYSTSLIANAALDFIRTEEEDDQPWFLVISTIAPHAPRQVEGRFVDSSVPGWSPSPGVTERDLTDKPPYVENRGNRVAQARKLRANQLLALKSVDDLVGRVVDGLERGRVEDQTLAFYISDNGVHWREHGAWGKGTPYRETVEVPFFAHWPGQLEVGLDDRMAANIDIAPTVLDAAGVEVPEGHSMDGRSLLDDWSRDELLIEYQKGNFFPAPTWASIRSRTHQYIRYLDAGGDVIFEELYDLQEDPSQLDNILALREGDPALASLKAALDRYRDCSGRACP